MKYQCQLWKIQLSTLFPSGPPLESVFWAYHMSEALARDAALGWASRQHGGVGIDTIQSVDLLD